VVSPDPVAVIANLVEDLPVGVWVARAPSGELLYANRRFQDIMGMAARGDVAAGGYSEPYGIHDLDGNLYPEARLPFARALEAGTTVVVDDLVIHRGDGSRVNVRAFARPATGAGGAISHVIVVFFDITREVSAERARAESERRLHRAQRMEAIGTLAGGIAHDFNNLLAGLKLVAAQLATGERDHRRREALATIDELTDRASHLTRSLLGFAGRAMQRPEPLGINPMVRAMGEIFRRTLAHDLSFELDLRATGDAVVVGDLAQLEQVLMNLVVNARDALVGAHQAGHVVVGTRDLVLAEPRGAVPAGTWVVLEVIDDGPGIPPSLRERVFEPYFTTKTHGGARGTGLGLATVFGLVESHQGAIEIDDGPGGRGTTIRVFLPAVARAVESPAALDPPAPLGGTGHVLVIDDEPVVRTALSAALVVLGYEVSQAASGAEGVELYQARAGAFRAVVLDMSMQGMGGRATYLALRAIDPDVRVLLVSGYTLNDEIQEVLDLGVRGFLSKPCSVEALATALARVMGDAPPARP